MGKWLDMAERLKQEHRAGDNKDVGDETTSNSHIVPIVLNVPASLPASIIMGLRRLRSMSEPRGVPGSVWSEIVSDACRIATDGWAHQSLALGWDALALFGVDPSPDSHAWDESLAVILRGRSICAVDDAAVYVRTDSGMHLFNRRSRPGLTKFLWEIGA